MMNSRQLLTPKQVARAIGVSESSLKRWCDRGTIPSVKTAGGHRRIELGAVLNFVRESRLELAEPDVLGIPSVTGAGERTWAKSQARLLEALVTGNEPVARQVVFDHYLAGHRIAEIADQLLHPVFSEIGRKWDCGEAEIYQERRACEICNRILFELQRALPNPSPTAPLAIGGTPEGDPYRLATAVAELVLREQGWRAVSLGSSLPFDTFRAAVLQHQPRLFWLSVSHLTDPERFIGEYRALYDSLSPRPAMVLGGRALTEAVRKELTYAGYCDNMRQLAAFAESLAPKPTSPRLHLHEDEEVA